METSYQIASAKIVHQTIDGEVMVICFDTGNYYSLTGAAADLWRMLISSPQTTSGLRSRFADVDQEADGAVKRFLDTLLAEGLIQAAPSAAAPAPPPAQTEAISASSLVIEKYSDLQSLLLLDPIHDAEEEGWPKLTERG
jgi:hypothetical protein